MCENNKKHIELSPIVHQQLQELANQGGVSLEEFVRIGLSLAKLVFEEGSKGNRVVVTDQDKTPLKVVLTPWSN